MSPTTLRRHSMLLSVLLVFIRQPAACQDHLTILFTHDLHSTFLPRAVVNDSGERTMSGGYARLASEIEQERRKNPDGTILVDAGDFSMGTVFHTLFSIEGPGLRLMARMGYDVLTLGNHEFDYHLDGLARCLSVAAEASEMRPTFVLSNFDLSGKDSSVAALRQALKRYGARDRKVLQRGQFRVGVFGIMGKDAAADAPFASPATFGDPVQAARQMVDSLRGRDGVDLVVCLSHSGTYVGTENSEDLELAKEVPGIDIIISAHSHRVLQAPIKVGPTIIGSAGAFGAYLGEIQFGMVDHRTPRLVSYRLLPIDTTVAEDPLIADSIAKFRAEVDSQFLKPYRLRDDQVIAESGFDFTPQDYPIEHPGESGLGDLIADAYRYAVRKSEGPDSPAVDLAIVPQGMIRGTILRGPITVADVFHTLSLGLGLDGMPGYPLVTAYLSAGDVRLLLEVEASIASMKGDAHLQVSGVRFRYNPYRIPMNRVTEVELIDDTGNLHPLDGDRLYRCCFSLYSAIMLSSITKMSYGVINVESKDRRGIPLKSWPDAIVDQDPAKPGRQELKEWLALAMYLESFPVDGNSGLPQVPDRYRSPAGRFAAEASLNPLDLLSHPNGFTIIAAAIPIALAAAAISLLARRRRRMRSRTGV